MAALDWLGVAKLPRFLKKAGAKVTAMSPKSFYLASSRYVDRRILGSADPIVAIDELRAHLKQREKPYDWVVLGDDALLAEAARRGRDPVLAKLLPAPAGERMAALSSKIGFNWLMEGAKVPLPRYATAPRAADILSAAEAVGYPVIVKPSRAWGGVGVFRADSPEDVKRRQIPEGEFIVQKYLKGRAGTSTALFFQGRPAFWFSSLSAAVHPEPYGPACSRQYIPLPKFESTLNAIGKALQFHGMCGIDWVIPEGTETPAVIELNGRPAPALEMAPRFGADLTAALTDFVAGVDAVRPPPEEADDRVFHMFPLRFQKAIHQRSLADMAKLASGLDGPVVVPWADPGLLSRIALTNAKGYLRWIGRRVGVVKPDPKKR